MPKQTVVKVNISGEKSKRQIFSTVAKLKGIQSMSVDDKEKTLTVVGEVEPVPIFEKLKKIGKKPVILTVGPPKPKPPQPRPCPPYCSCASCCHPHPPQRDVVCVGYPPYDDGGPSQFCPIL